MIIVGIEEVRVDEEEVHGEVVELYRALVVQGRLQPSTSAELQLRPSICNHLVPAVGEHETTVVVVSQHPKPLLSVEAIALVHNLIDVAPLEPRIRDFVHRRSALHVDATPVEVVSKVDNKIWIPLLGIVAHPPADVELGPVVGGVHLLPMVGRKDLACVVRCLGRVNLPWIHVLVEEVDNATPVSDHENVVQAFRIVEKAGLRQFYTVQFSGDRWWVLPHSKPRKTGILLLYLRIFPGLRLQVLLDLLALKLFPDLIERLQASESVGRLSVDMVHGGRLCPITSFRFGGRSSGPRRWDDSWLLGRRCWGRWRGRLSSGRCKGFSTAMLAAAGILSMAAQ
mmetsp:Transcript_111341/g.265621  ORF Transcript_111341/g.265621 Transcript_111341/m.265621 type:complete len:340 (+) Transcript_111341:672-1691(+)